jgi:hypothetical protein
MDTLVVHVLNALLYASVMFLIAGGLSLIYGVMRIVNLAHGNLYAFGAYVTAWAVGRALGGATEASFWMYALLPVGAIAAAALGAVLEPTLLRPLYRRAEEYQLAASRPPGSGPSSTAPSSAWCCARRPRTCGWRPPSASMSTASTCRPSRSAASWRAWVGR